MNIPSICAKPAGSPTTLEKPNAAVSISPATVAILRRATRSFVGNPRSSPNLRSLFPLFTPLSPPPRPPFETSFSPSISSSSSSSSHVASDMEGCQPEKKLYTSLRLWEFPDQYVFEPADGTADSYLSISRANGSMKLIGDLPKSGSGQAPKVRTVFGLIGMLRLLVGSYLFVITQRESVGSYLGHSIFKVSRLEILQCNHSLNSSSTEEKKMESEFSMLLNAADRISGLYFSYDANITVCAQRLHDLKDESMLLPLWRQADPRFLWNSYMLEPMIDHDLDPYLLPVMQGSFQSFQTSVGSNTIDVTLIARRCTRRIGTRMWRRGADSEGYVANFVETEQILHWNGFSVSFVQVRGSIPLLWEQIVDLTYKPSFEIVRAEEASRVAERHFLDLNKKYGSVLAVDLVNKLVFRRLVVIGIVFLRRGLDEHGGEGRLGEKFASAMQAIASDSIKYLQFDFHRICGHIHFERLAILYEQIEDYLKKHRYFLLNGKGEKVKEQLGVVRTNCIDCLDRTNVTQSMIGRKMLESQLHQIGIFSSDEIISGYPDFDAKFKILWANHGDAISIQYSGTPALKGDFVRYGRRTTHGILKDGWNALARYYFNNFADGTKQDAMDILQGHYIVSVSRDMASPFQTKGLEAYASFKLAMMMVLVGVWFAMLSLRQAPNDARHLLFSVVWASLSFGISAFVRANGRMFTNRPRLFRSRH